MCKGYDACVWVSLSCAHNETVSSLCDELRRSAALLIVQLQGCCVCAHSCYQACPLSYRSGACAHVDSLRVCVMLSGALALTATHTARVLLIRTGLSRLAQTLIDTHIASVR